MLFEKEFSSFNLFKIMREAILSTNSFARVCNLFYLVFFMAIHHLLTHLQETIATG